MEQSQIDTWWIPLTSSSEVSALSESILSREERLRADRFHFAEHARQFRVCHVALRIVLEKYLHQPAQTILLTTAPLGKPVIADHTRVHFSLSHTNDVAIVAVSSDLEVGVDIEQIRFDLRVGEMLSCFTLCEQEILRETNSNDARVAAFFRLWTRKEAVLKADGAGLRSALNGFDVSRSRDEVVSFPEGTQQLWRVDDLEVPSGYFAALAAPPGSWSVRWRRLWD